MTRLATVVAAIHQYDRDTGKGVFDLAGEQPRKGLEAILYGAVVGMPVLLDEDDSLMPSHLSVARSDYTYYLQGPFDRLTPAARRVLWREAKGNLEGFLREAPAEKLAELLGEVQPAAVLDQLTTWAAKRELWYFVRDLGFSLRQAQTLLERHADIEKVLLQAPYSLYGTRGIGFATLDKAALQVGVDPQATPRLAAALKVVTDLYWGQGHTAYPEAKLVADLSAALNVTPEIANKFLEQVVSDGSLRVRGERDARFYTTPEFEELEQGAAERLRTLLATPCEPLVAKLAAYPHLKTKQRQAVIAALSSRIVIMTGGPGTGKTTTVCTAVSEYKRHGLGDRIVLAAPTGKAARRLAESTGYEATTVHTLLNYHPEEGWRVNRDNPIDADVVIIDEQSMMDTMVFYRLLDALPDNVRLLLVGDPEQLPSVDSGNVLRDMIDSGCVPVVTLDEPQRFGASSGIHHNAKRLKNGDSVEYLDREDFHWKDASDDADIEAAIMSVFAPESLSSMGVTSEDVQILCPQKGGLVGVHALNLRLKAFLQPETAPSQRFTMGTETFCVGDRVMHTRNDRTLGVNNGDVGFIREVNLGRRQVRVQYDDKFKDVPLKCFADVRLAFAKTIHKSQGSEYPVVIIPVSANHKRMLSRELVYTALTRGKKHVFMIGDRDVLESSLKFHAQAGGRNTLLQAQLASALPQQLPNSRFGFRRPAEEDAPSC